MSKNPATLDVLINMTVDAMTIEAAFLAELRYLRETFPHFYAEQQMNPGNVSTENARMLVNRAVDLEMQKKSTADAHRESGKRYDATLQAAESNTADLRIASGGTLRAVRLDYDRIALINSAGGLHIFNSDGTLAKSL
jgi:hypothetical protein